MITAGGLVTSPAIFTGNITCSLTATIIKNDATDTKSFTLTVTSTVLEKILHASDKQANDNLGYSVSIDENFTIVGGLYEDGGTGDPTPNTGCCIYLLLMKLKWSLDD